MHNKADKHQLIMKTPAASWKDAIPLGNGILGAMIYGNIYQEKILLNHENLWLKRKTQDLPNISSVLPELRKLMKQKEYHSADSLMGEELKKQGYSPEFSSYLPGFNINLKMETVNPFVKYNRILDMENGEVRVNWFDGNIEFERKAFVSLEDNLLALSVSNNSHSGCNFEINLTPHSEKETKEEKKIQSSFSFIKNVIGNTLQVQGENTDGKFFGCLITVISDGLVSLKSDDTFTIHNGKSTLILCDLYSEADSREWKKVLSKLDKVKENYDALFSRHRMRHSELFNRMSLDLNCEKMNSSNEELLLNSYSGECSTELIQKMFEYGRYLLIASSAKGSVPSHLQGLWNGDYTPTWNSFIMSNENLQMNHWQSLPGNMSETLFPVFDFFESRMKDFETNARNLFGCRGIFIPADISPDSGLLKDMQGHIINWTAGAGWIAQFFYDYYLFTDDKDFLKERALPFMKSVADFYEDFLVKNTNGEYEFIPSVSPENAPEVFNPEHKMDAEVNISINATMDIAICKELLTNLINGSKLTGLFSESIIIWEDILEGLPEYTINSDGAFSEWLHEDFPDNYYHRHLSQLYPVFPGFEITGESKFHESCRKALDQRLLIGFKEQTAWSLSHMANIYARMTEGDSALDCLKLLLKTCIGKNFFTYHNDLRKQGVCEVRAEDLSDKIFQIDANMGFTSAVLEMIVFSKPGSIHLLPGIPSQFDSGKAQGILCRGGILLDLEWSPKSLVFTIRSQSAKTIQIHYPKGCLSIELVNEAGKLEILSVEGYSELTVEKEVPVDVTIYY